MEPNAGRSSLAIPTWAREQAERMAFEEADEEGNRRRDAMYKQTLFQALLREAASIAANNAESSDSGSSAQGSAQHEAAAVEPIVAAEGDDILTT